ncbi:MAG: hypothetical protein GX604_03770 [Actinobacteria bacterium]|nr:hypothetical protein [Actinomycetota bacterium]
MRARRGTARVMIVVGVMVLACVLVAGVGLVLLSGCGASPPFGDNTSATRIEVTSSTLIDPPTALMAQGAYGIPAPIIDGGFSWLGFGRFQLLQTNAGSNTAAGGGHGSQFFWRDGRYVWEDGRLMEVDEGLRRLMREKGLSFPDHQPSLANPAYQRLGVVDFSGLSTDQALSALVHELGGLGWWVRHTYIDALEPLAVTFALEEDDNGPFVEEVLLRAAINAGTRGLAIASVRVEYLGHSSGRPQELNPADNLEEAAAKLCPAPPTAPDNDSVRAMVAAALPGERAYPGWTLRLLEVASNPLESRRVTVWVEAPHADRAQAEAYMNEVLETVRSLNVEHGAGVAVVYVSVVDTGGNAVSGARCDLDLGRDSFFVNLP